MIVTLNIATTADPPMAAQVITVATAAPVQAPPPPAPPTLNFPWIAQGAAWLATLTPASLTADGLAADIGAVGRYRPAHIGSDKPVEDLYPVIEAHLGDRWQISLDDGIKYAALIDGAWSAGGVVEYREAFVNKLPPQAPHMPSAIEYGGFVTWKAPFGDIETRLRHAINTYDGWSGDLSYDVGGYITPTTGIGLEVRGEWADQYFADRFLKVANDSNFLLALPQFAASNYHTLGAQITAGQKISGGTTLFLQASLDRIFGEAWRPPVIDNRNVFVLCLGATWHFGAADPERP